MLAQVLATLVVAFGVALIVVGAITLATGRVPRFVGRPFAGAADDRLVHRFGIAQIALGAAFVVVRADAVVPLPDSLMWACLVLAIALFAVSAGFLVGAYRRVT